MLSSLQGASPELPADGLQRGQQADGEDQDVEGEDGGLGQPQEQVLTGGPQPVLTQQEVGDEVSGAEGKMRRQVMMKGAEPRQEASDSRRGVQPKFDLQELQGEVAAADGGQLLKTKPGGSDASVS